MDGIGRKLGLKLQLIYFIGILLFANQCKISHPETFDQDTSEPSLLEIDKPLANMFEALNGKWSGQFHIYEHVNGQAYQTTIPNQLTHAFLSNLNLKETNSIDVQQEYRSKTPYYQTVVITDTYHENGEKKDVVSTGVNKIQDGKLWCVVEKPE